MDQGASHVIDNLVDTHAATLRVGSYDRSPTLSRTVESSISLSFRLRVSFGVCVTRDLSSLELNVV